MLHFTFGPSFKVKRWFSGFGELSFRWIQICIGSPMRRSSLMVVQFINWIQVVFDRVIIALISNIEGVGPWWRYTLSVLVYSVGV